MRAFGIAMVHAFVKSTGGAGVRPPPTPTAAPSPPRVDRLPAQPRADRPVLRRAGPSGTGRGFVSPVAACGQLPRRHPARRDRCVLRSRPEALMLADRHVG